MLAGDTSLARHHVEFRNKGWTLLMVVADCSEQP